MWEESAFIIGQLRSPSVLFIVYMNVFACKHSFCTTTTTTKKLVKLVVVQVKRLVQYEEFATTQHTFIQHDFISKR